VYRHCSPYAIGPLSCLSCPVLSVCNVGVLWSNGWMDQDETWRARRPRPYCVKWGSSSPRRGTVPHFLAMSVVTKTAGWIKMPLGREADLGPGHTVLVGDPAPSPKGHSPQFSAHVCCGQLRPRPHCVRWGSSSP